MSYLSIRNLSVAAEGRRRPCCAACRWTVAAGEVRGLVGESGAGKSMIGKAMLGILPRVGRDHRRARSCWTGRTFCACRQRNAVAASGPAAR